MKKGELRINASGGHLSYLGPPTEFGNAIIEVW
jgi:hypothetical protein